MAHSDVLIVGAGPTGLVLALWLTRQGVAVRIVDKSSGPGEASRAMAVQARTLELYRQLDLAEAVIDAGYKTPAMNLWARGSRRARIPLIDAGREVSAYPFVLIYPQDRHERLTFEDVGHDAINGLNLEITEVNWFSTYRVHHRVTDHFRRGRAFLLGDAAHVHSPAGGQGMNTGIVDAINLAWKLAAVVQGKAPDALLDSYQIERQAFARTLVETTDRLFTLVTAQGGFADFVRTRIAPIFASVAYKRESVREYLFRVISQTTLDYRGSPLSQGKAGGVQGGDRLPWLTGGAADNYASLAAIEWQVHVYGQAKADLSQWCAKHGIALHVFAWEQACEKAGFGRNAAYLLRPDSYVALADPEGEASTLSRYFEARGVVLPS